ncbi:MAG: 16S rRNA processing protein RimM [Leptospira sp.]|nr:16S rRNA processing protein RimM [Leptospira sp.]
MEWVSIGYLSSSHGIKGMAKVKHTGDSWNQLQFPRSIRFIKEDKTLDLLILSASVKPDYTLISCENATQPEFWDDWKGASLNVRVEDLDEIQNNHGEYFFYQLEGLQVLDEDFKSTDFDITRVLESPAHPILECSCAGKTIMIPFVNEWVGDIDLENKTIIVKGWENWLAL